MCFGERIHSSKISSSEASKPAIDDLKVFGALRIIRERN